MLIIICLLLFTILLFTIVFFADEYGYEFIGLLSGVFGIISTTGLIIIICAIIVSHITANADVAALQQQYKSLTYQLENIDTLYGNSHANDKKELYNQIQEWNKGIAHGRTMHESIWTNWLQPIDYRNLEYIEMK